MIMYLSTKGQATIPQAVREQVGLCPGSAVEIAFRDGEIYLRRTNDAAFLAGQSHRRYHHKDGTRDRTCQIFYRSARDRLRIDPGHPRPTKLPTAFSTLEIDRTGHACWRIGASRLSALLCEMIFQPI